MSEEEFIELFIEKCIDNDVSSHKGICDEALKRINEIRLIIDKENKLRLELKNLERVLRYLGYQEAKSKRKKKVINNGGSLFSNDPSYINLIGSICNFIETSDEKVTPRTIMNNVGDLEDNTNVYMAIKWLCDNGILTRTDDRLLVPGEKWEDRPTGESKEFRNSG